MEAKEIALKCMQSLLGTKNIWSKCTVWCRNENQQARGREKPRALEGVLADASPVTQALEKAVEDRP